MKSESCKDTLSDSIWQYTPYNADFDGDEMNLRHTVGRSTGRGQDFDESSGTHTHSQDMVAQLSVVFTTTYLVLTYFQDLEH